MKYLVVIGMQNDYVTGALKNEAAQAIVPGICNKIKEYNANKFPVFLVYDKRDDNYLLTYEGKHFAACDGLPDEIEIVGTRTDADILSTAIIVKNEFRERPVVVDASLCAGTTPDKHYLALNAMKCAQIEVINEGKEPWA